MEKKLISHNSELITLALILVLCLSCKAQKKGSTKENEVAKDSVLTLVLCDDYGGSEIQEIRVIKDEKSLKMAFAKINITRKPGLPVPKLDFSKEIAVLASRGEAKGSSQIQLKFYSETSERLIFEAEEVANSQEPESTAITTPFCLYTMPFTQKEIIFKEMTD